MADLIDREALLAESRKSFCSIHQLIKDAPRVDAVEFDDTGGEYVDPTDYIAPKPTVVTNGDRIRSMTDEELGKLLFDLGYEAYQYALKPNLKPIADTQAGWIDWVKQPVEVYE